MAYVDWLKGARLQTWTTPRVLFEALNARYQFTLDGAATADSALLPRFSSFDEPQPWAGERVFCNPPWSNIPPFVELAAQADVAVLLVPARTNCRWFHRALQLKASVDFFPGRLRFSNAKSNSPVDCLLLVWG